MIPSSKFATQLALSLFACVAVLTLSNCSVDLSPSTPGASTTGACGTPSSEQALLELQPVIDGFLMTSCASCHAVTTGTTRSGFYTPDPGASGADRDVQIFTYTQICVRGGKAVADKISSAANHGGGAFSSAAFDAYLESHF
jgi:hypothetical protein